MADYDPFQHPEFIQLTGRSKAIEVLQRYYDSTQYEGRADWWTGKKGGAGEIVPLRERKPCVIYELPKAATNQVVRFLFGGARFPKFQVHEAESDGVVSVELSEEDAKEVSAWLAEFVDRSHLRSRVRAIAKRAISTKTAVAILSISRGQFRITTPRAQDCWAEFIDQDPASGVKRLVWSYEYDAEVADRNGRPVTKRYRFRREWDETTLRVYESAELITGKDIVWGAPTESKHGFTFCPALWIPNQAEDGDNGMDGYGLYEGLEDEIDVLNFTHSQKHRGVHYWGTPQPWQTGVDDGDGPGAEGRTAKQGTPGYSPSVQQHGATEQAVQRAPEHLWTYASIKAQLGLLETTGKAHEISSKAADDHRAQILEQMGVVLTSLRDQNNDGTAGSHQMSARFLALAHAPLLALIGEMRHPWWSFCLQPILSMALRMLTELKGVGVLVPNSISVAEILSDHTIDLEGEKLWVCPTITPVWGRFFDPSVTEIKEASEAVAAAVKARVLTIESGVRFLADSYGIENVEAEIEALNGLTVVVAPPEGEQAPSDNKDEGDDGEDPDDPADEEDAPDGESATED